MTLTIAEMQKIIEDKMPDHLKYVKRVEVARRYYLNKNDIKTNKSPANRNRDDDEGKLLRKADNRVSNNFHQLLVDQKAAYLLTDPPAIDVVTRQESNLIKKVVKKAINKKLNKKILQALGDKYAKVAKSLAINASNDEVAWLHVWETTDKVFKYAIVDSTQIIPIFSDELDRELVGVMRRYEGTDYTYFEFWNDKECHAFKQHKGRDSTLEFDFKFASLKDQTPSEVYVHDWGKVPFIPFANNNREANDLEMYKGHVDVYDKTYNGFVNDIEDIQEVILLLKGYGGTDLEKFMEELNRHKAADVDEEGAISTISIEIPTEARTIMLEMTRKRIFEAGQGLDPLDERIGTSSGVALKYKYSLLEMKSALMEAEFRFGFAELVRFILIHLDKNPENFTNIQQTWTRTAINNDLEQAQIIAQLASVTSRQNLAKANPLVEDWEEEMELLKQEELDMYRAEDDYKPKDSETSDNLEDLEDE